MVCVGTKPGTPAFHFEVALFDFAATLVPTAHLGVAAFDRVIHNAGVDPGEFRSDFLRYWNRTGTRNGLHDVMESAVGHQHASRLASEFWKHFNTLSLTTHESPGVTETLQRLSECGAKVGLVSQVHRKHLKAQLDARNWTRYFDLVIAFEDIPVSKPSPLAHYSAMKHFGIDPTRGISFEHSVSGLHAATQAHLMTVHSGCVGEWDCNHNADAHVVHLWEISFESSAAPV